MYLCTMKTIKDLKEAINSLPDNMPITMYMDGASYYNNIQFNVRKMWGNGKQEDYFVIDKKY